MNAIVTSFHSPETASRPRSENCRNPITTLQSELALFYRPRFLAWQNSENGSFWNISGYQELFRQWQRRNGLSDLATINQYQMYGAMIRDGSAVNSLPTDYAAEFAAHPEYLTLTESGEPGAKFCVTEPGLQTLAITYAKEWLSAHPGNTTVSMAPSDGDGDWGGCRNGEHEIYSPSERMVLLANAVAQSLQADPAYAGTHVAVLAYGLTSQPPVQVTVDPWVHVSFVDHRNFKGGGTDVTLVEGWKAKGMTTLNLYEYLNVQTWSYDLPGAAKASHYGEMAEAIKSYYDWGAHYLVSEGGTAWGPNGLGFWLIARMLCEPEKLADPAILEHWQSDFLEKAFGPAAVPMRTFYANLAGEPYAQPLSRDLIGRMYGLLAEARALTGDPAILARLDDLALYVRFVELSRTYRITMPADAQAAYDGLGQFAFLINDRVMLDRYLMPVIDATDPDVAAPANTAPPSNQANNPWLNPLEDADNSDFTDTDFTAEEITALINDGISANPLKPFAQIAYSTDLIPATALALPETTRLYFNYLFDFHRWWLWTEVPGDIQFTVKAGMVALYRNRGNTDLGLYAANGTEPEATATVAPTNTDETVTLAATSAGLHSLEVADPATGVDIEWDAALPMVMGVGEGDTVPYYGAAWDGYFYVPKGTTVIGAYQSGSVNRSDAAPTLQIVDPDGNVALAADAIPWYDHFSVPVPDGMDGKLWKVENAFQDRFRLYTVPPYITRSAAESLLPREVVEADRP